MAYRKSYSQGQRDGSKNRYRPTGKNPLWAGLTGWSKRDQTNKTAYDKGYKNGRAHPKRKR